MKRLLFATTALVATAGMAAAEVKLSGAARFGLGYHEDRAENVASDPTSDVSDTILVSRFRLNIDVEAESDGGTQFGGRVRLQAEENTSTGEADTAGLNGANFFVEHGGLHVAVGNIGGAIDNLPNYYGKEPGLEAIVNQYSGINYSNFGYSSAGQGVNGVFFKYAVGNFAFQAGYDQSDARNAPTATSRPGELTTGDRWDVSLAYTFNNITAAIGHAQNDIDQSLTVLTLGGEFGDFAGSVLVADDDVGGVSDGTAFGVSGEYTFGAAALTFAYGDGSGDNDTRNIGIGASYDLGGSVKLVGGIGEIKEGDADGVMRADFGVTFNF